MTRYRARASCPVTQRRPAGCSVVGMLMAITDGKDDPGETEGTEGSEQEGSARLWTLREGESCFQMRRPGAARCFMPQHSAPGETAESTTDCAATNCTMGNRSASNIAAPVPATIVPKAVVAAPITSDDYAAPTPVIRVAVVAIPAAVGVIVKIAAVIVRVVVAAPVWRIAEPKAPPAITSVPAAVSVATAISVAAAVTVPATIAAVRSSAHAAREASAVPAASADPRPAATAMESASTTMAATSAPLGKAVGGQSQPDCDNHDHEFLHVKPPALRSPTKNSNRHRATGLPMLCWGKHLKTQGGIDSRVVDLPHSGGGSGPADDCIPLTPSETEVNHEVSKVVPTNPAPRSSPCAADHRHGPGAGAIPVPAAGTQGPVDGQDPVS